MLLEVATVSLFLVAILVVQFIKMKPGRKPQPSLMVQNWTPDMVYLCQFPPSQKVRSISPFSLKLETWLRLAKIPYKNVYTRKFASASHTIPYIELNGVQVADSSTIMAFLRKQYSVEFDPDSLLTEEQVAVSHCVSSMVENHTAQIGFWWRYGLKMDDFAREALSTWKNTFGMRWFMPMGLRLKGRLCVFGRLETSEAMELSFRDLDTLSSLLKNKAYFHGSHPTSLDCTIFGHLAQFLFIDIGFPQKDYMQQNAANLIDFVERVKRELWPDWDEMCRDENNEAHVEQP